MNTTNYRLRSDKRTYACIPLLILIVCIYIGIYHSHRYFGFDSDFWLGITGLLCLVALHTILFDVGKVNKYKFSFFVLVVGVPLLSLVILMHMTYRKHQFAGNKVKVPGVVTELFTRRAKRSHTDYAIFTYQVDHKAFRQIVKNEDNKLYVGDTIIIVCSAADPEVFRFVSK
ncbi:MAG: hypothetical protein WKF66_02170 [Pedobacter sp.]